MPLISDVRTGLHAAAKTASAGTLPITVPDRTALLIAGTRDVVVVLQLLVVRKRREEGSVGVGRRAGARLVVVAQRSRPKLSWLPRPTTTLERATNNHLPTVLRA